MIVVFDSTCLLCNGWVRFLLRHDRSQAIRFASMQGKTGSRLLAEAGLDANALQTLLVIDGKLSFQHTPAILHIVEGLGWPWRALAIIRLIPAPIRDALYRLIAHNRYRVFGQTTTCLRPLPDQVQRFLD